MQTLSTSDKQALADHKGLKVQNTDNLQSILRGGAKFIGCRDEVPDSMMSALKHRVVTKYKEFTYTDVTNAFNYYLDNITDKKKIYELDGFTLSSVLNLYWSYLSGLKVKLKAKEADNTTDQLNPETIVKDEDGEKDSFEFIDNYCKNNSTLPFGANWNWAYDHAIRVGIIEKDSFDFDCKKEMTADKIRGESVSRRDPKLYRNQNLESDSLENRTKEDFIKEYMKIEHGVTNHKYAL